LSRIKKLEGTDIQSIRKWFAETVAVIGGEGWHADDDPTNDPIINGKTGEHLFSDEEAVIVSQSMRQIFRAAKDWHDSDMVYDLAMNGSFDVEKLYPGFILDVSLIAGRLGYVTIPGREHPNLLVEEFSQYAILEFPDRPGPVSEHDHFILKAVEKSSVGYPIDPNTLVVLEDQSLEFTYIDELDERIVELARGMRTIRP
jgi:hypothetical protein